MVRLHYAWKYKFLRTSSNDETVKRYNKKHHASLAAMLERNAEAAAASAAGASAAGTSAAGAAGTSAAGAAGGAEERAAVIADVPMED